MYCSVIKEYNRQKLEEAIAAMLVLPCPQNLLIYKSGLENRPPNGPPVDNLFLLSRYLGTFSSYLICLVYY